MGMTLLSRTAFLRRKHRHIDVLGGGCGAGYSHIEAIFGACEHAA